jgi:hypothetical protein
MENGGLKILNHFSEEEIRSFRAKLSKENNSDSKQAPSSSPLNPLQLFSWIKSLFRGQ